MRTIVLMVMAAVTALAMNAERLVVLTDIHVEPGNANDSVMAVAVAEINGMAGVDYVIVDGDLTNEGSDEQLVNVKRHLDAIAHPLLTLPGNHENNWSQSAGTTWLRLWGADRGYAVTPGGLVLAGVNCGPYMKMGDGHIKQEDLHWLDATLAEATSVAGRRVLSLCHFPLIHDLDNVADYIALLEKYPVIGHISGHYHRPEAYTSAGGGINCFTARALDLRDGKPGYTLVDVTADSVIVSMKLVGVAEPERFTAWAIHPPYPSAETTEPIAPKAPGFTFARLWADSASVFTRVLPTERGLVFGTSTGVVKMIDHAGSLKWSHSTGKPLYGRAAELGGSIFVPATTGEMLIFNRENGALTRRVDLGAPAVADPVTANGMVYAGGFKAMRFITPQGAVRHTVDSIGNYCQAMPWVDGCDLIFGAWDRNLYCVDAISGKVRWKWNNGRPGNLYSPGNVVPAVTDNHVIIVAPDRYMTCIDRATGATVWRDNSVKYRESMGMSEDRRTVYAKTMDGELVAVDATAPAYTRRWLTDTGIGYDHAPCIVAEADGVVYMGSRRGILTAVDAATGRMLWSERLGSSEINGIEIDPRDRSIILSMVEGTLWRVTPQF